MPLLRVSLNDHWMNFTQMLTAMKIGQEKMYLYRQPVKNKNWTPNKLRNSKVLGRTNRPKKLSPLSRKWEPPWLRK